MRFGREAGTDGIEDNAGDGQPFAHFREGGLVDFARVAHGDGEAGEGEGRGEGFITVSLGGRVDFGAGRGEHREVVGPGEGRLAPGKEGFERLLNGQLAVK